MSGCSAFLSEMRNTPWTLSHSSRRPACKSLGFSHNRLNLVAMHRADSQTQACPAPLHIRWAFICAPRICTGKLAAASSRVTSHPRQQPSEPTAASAAQPHLVPRQVWPASHGIPQHPAASHCIPPHPSVSRCLVTKGELIYSFQMCWSKGKMLPS